MTSLTYILNEKFPFFRNSWSHLLKSTGKVMAKFMTQWVSVKLRIVSGNFFTHIAKRFKTFEIEAHIVLIRKVHYFFFIKLVIWPKIAARKWQKLGSLKKNVYLSFKKSEWFNILLFFFYFFELTIDFRSLILALFNCHFLPFNKSDGKSKNLCTFCGRSNFLQQFWNIFIKFH